MSSYATACTTCGQNLVLEIVSYFAGEPMGMEHPAYPEEGEVDEVMGESECECNLSYKALQEYWPEVLDHAKDIW
jgi:hypothetical protein